MFDHAQSARLGQKTPVESPGVFLCTVATMPEVAWRGMLIYLIDSDELKVYDGTVWRDAGSSTPGQQTHVGPTEPVADFVGQQWVNTTDYKVYVWNGTEWVTTGESEEADTYSAFFAVRLANAIRPLIESEPYIQIWYGSSPPTSPTPYWFWVNTATNVVYQRNYTDTAWDVVGGDAGQSILLAGLDRSLADEKIDLYVDHTYPGILGPEDIGDVWVDLSQDTEPVMVWTGAGWYSANTLATDLIAQGITDREIKDRAIGPDKVGLEFAQALLISGSQLTDGELQTLLDAGTGGLRGGSSGDGSVLFTGAGIRVLRSDNNPRVFLPTSDEETAFIEGESHFEHSTIEDLRMSETASVGINARVTVEAGITPPPAPRLVSETPLHGVWSNQSGLEGGTHTAYFWAPSETAANNIVIDLYGGLTAWRARLIDPADGSTTHTSDWYYQAPAYGGLAYEQIVGITHLTAESGWRVWFVSDKHPTHNNATIYSRKLTRSGSTWTLGTHHWGGTINIGSGSTSNLCVNNNTYTGNQDIMVAPVPGVGFRLWLFNNSTGRIVDESVTPNPPEATFAVGANNVTIDSSSRAIWCDRVYPPGNDGLPNTFATFYQIAYKGRFYTWNAASTTGTLFAANTAYNWEGTWPQLSLAAARSFNGVTRTWPLGSCDMLVGYSSSGMTYVYKPTNYWYTGTRPTTLVRSAYYNSTSARRSMPSPPASLARYRRTSLAAYDGSTYPVDASSAENSPDTMRWWFVETTTPNSVPPANWRYMGQDPQTVTILTKPTATTPELPETSTFLAAAPGRIESGAYRPASTGKAMDLRGDGTGNLDAVVPPGTLLLWSAATTYTSPPPGFLFADGSSQLVAEYPDLAHFYWNGSAYQFGSSGGSSFNLPNVPGPGAGIRYIIKT